MKNIKINILNVLILLFSQSLISMEERSIEEQKTYMQRLPVELTKMIEQKRILIEKDINKQMEDAIEKVDEAKVKELLKKYGPKVFSPEMYFKAALKFQELANSEKGIESIDNILKLLSKLEIIGKYQQDETLLIKLFKSGISAYPVLEHIIKKLKAMPELERKNYINAKDILGSTALMYSPLDSFLGLTEIIRLGPDANLKNNDGQTVFHIINEIGTLKEFLKYSPEVNLNEQDHRGRTPLITAVLMHKFDKVKLLLEHGANPNIKDIRNKTALYYAKYYLGDEDKITKLLKEYGATK